MSTKPVVGWADAVIWVAIAVGWCGMAAASIRGRLGATTALLSLVLTLLTVAATVRVGLRAWRSKG